LTAVFFWVYDIYSKSVRQLFWAYAREDTMITGTEHKSDHNHEKYAGLLWYQRAWVKAAGGFVAIGGVVVVVFAAV
jgi:hypothetical protein